MEKLERWKILAEALVEENNRAKVEDISGNLYFGLIVIVGENSFMIQCDGPPQRAGSKPTLYWANITKFDRAVE